MADLIGIVGGLIVGSLAGSLLQVSGPAAGLIVLVTNYVMQAKEAWETGQSRVSVLASLGVVVFLAGLIQIAMAFLRLGLWFRAVSPAVILGIPGEAFPELVFGGQTDVCFTR